MKKGDDVVVKNDDDNVVRNSLSQNWVTATLCTEELFLRTQPTDHPNLSNVYLGAGWYLGNAGSHPNGKGPFHK
jgi:hypothetical protein